MCAHGRAQQPAKSRAREPARGSERRSRRAGLRRPVAVPSRLPGWRCCRCRRTTPSMRARGRSYFAIGLRPSRKRPRRILVQGFLQQRRSTAPIEQQRRTPPGALRPPTSRTGGPRTAVLGVEGRHRHPTVSGPSAMPPDRAARQVPSVLPSSRDPADRAARGHDPNGSLLPPAGASCRHEGRIGGSRS